ncbi:MAG: hypothetical protein V4607_08340 [Pseudomonadota bacterium]
MKKLGTLLLSMFAVLPVYAQDEAAADTAAPAAEEAAPADAAPADAAPADTAAAPAEEAPAEAAATDAAPAADETAATEAAPAAAEAAPADASAEAAPADAAATDAAAAESAPADSTGTDAAALTDGSAPAEVAPADASAEAATDGSTEAAASETPTEEPAAEERKPWQLYAGYNYVLANFLASSPSSPPTPNPANQFSTDNLHGKFHDVRFGARFFDVVGLEAHYGFKAGSDDKPDSMGVKNNMALYIVPTGTLFDVVEIAALVGYARTKLEHDGKELSLNGASYGANMEVPLRPLLGDWMPDLRLGGGFMVYHQDSKSRVYGSHVGVRYDFKI